MMINGMWHTRQGRPLESALVVCWGLLTLIPPAVEIEYWIFIKYRPDHVARYPLGSTNLGNSLGHIIRRTRRENNSGDQVVDVFDLRANPWQVVDA